jgi:hypothetical protein
MTTLSAGTGAVKKRAVLCRERGGAKIPPKDTQSVDVKCDKLSKRLAEGLRQASGEFTHSNGPLNNGRPSGSYSLANRN